MKITKSRLARLRAVAEYAREHEGVTTDMVDGLVTPDELIALLEAYINIIYKR
jgi:hypothetical protein